MHLSSRSLTFDIIFIDKKLAILNSCLGRCIISSTTAIKKSAQPITATCKPKKITLAVSFSPSPEPPPPAQAAACAQQVRQWPPLQNGSVMEQPPNSTAIPAPNAAIPQRRPTIKISGRLPRIPNRIN